MRAFGHRRQGKSERIVLVGPGGLPNAEALAKRAKYVGSALHKNAHTRLGPGAVRPGKSVCDLASNADFPRATRWLRHAIENGACTAPESAPGFPKRCYYRDRNTRSVYEALHMGEGEYKGWKLDPHKIPRGI